MEKTFYDYGKPTGKEGEDLLDLMDEGHTPVSLWALTNLDVNEDDVTLDIGCGSGLNVKRLHEKSNKTKTYGVDHSSTSVKKSIIMNQEEVDAGNVIIQEANVLNMPFEDKYFDLITGFETVYFWPEIINSFKEVKRVLKDEGKFFIVLEANGCHDPELENKAKNEGCTFYTDSQLKELLLEAGYTKIAFYFRNRKDNLKTIKKITPTECTEKTVDDLFDGDNYEEELKSGEYQPSSEWMCIIAQK